MGNSPSWLEVTSPEARTATPPNDALYHEPHAIAERPRLSTTGEEEGRGALDEGERDLARRLAADYRLQQVLARAWTGRDRATVERIIAPEWRSTGPDGRATDRPQLLADVFEKRVHKIHTVEIDDVRVRVYGDAAVVTGRTHGVGEFAGSPYDVVIQFTDTFVRRAGQWQAVASHASLFATGQ